MRAHTVAVAVVASMLLAVVAGCSDDEANNPVTAPNVVDASTEDTGAISDTLMIDDMEHADEGHILKIDGRDGIWFTVNDTMNAPGSTTTQWPAMGQPFPYDAPGAHGSAKAAHTYGVTDPNGIWGATTGINFRGEGNALALPYDASKYGGISFWAKSDKAPLVARFSVGDTRTMDNQSGGKCVGSQCNDAFGAEVPIGATWEKHSYQWCKLRQDGWGYAERDLLVPELLNVTFGFPVGETFDLWIDDLAFLPGPAAPCVDGGWTTPPPPDAASFCSARATEALIDDMTGSNLTFMPPACGSKGNWQASGWNGATVTSPVVPGGTDLTSIAGNCGSLCLDLRSPLPPGFPGTTADADAGSTASDAGDASAPNSMAMCIAGTITGTKYSGAGMGLSLAYAGVLPEGGPLYTFSDGGLNPDPPLPVLIDASSYAGIQFWLWVSPETVARFSAEFEVWASDKNETSGFGVCDSDINATDAACCGARASISGGSVWWDGRLLGADGGALATLSAGWQLIRIPWANFLVQSGCGGANETVVDPTTLNGLSFMAQQNFLGHLPYPFNFCVYQLSFYK